MTAQSFSRCILVVACGLVSFGGQSAVAKTIADWKFQAPAGTALAAIPDAVGGAKFEGETPGVAVADGVLRVRRPVPDVNIVYAPLPAVPREQPLWLVAEFTGWNFTGKRGEGVSFGFADEREDPDFVLSAKERTETVLAEAQLLRLVKDMAGIRARAGGGVGATGLPSPGGRRLPMEQTKPFFLALYYDQDTATYAMLSKEEGQPWRLASRGATDPRRHPRFVRLAFNSILNDSAKEGVDIRRISVSTTPPDDLKPGTLPDAPFITAPQWAVSRADTGEILGGEGVDTPARMASINKSITLFVICQLAAKDPKILDETITATAASEAAGGSHSMLVEGDSLPVRDALYAMMLPSGNDMGALLAEHFTPRFAPPEQPLPASIPAVRVNFIAEMNRQAKALGMTSSSFRNPFTDGGAPSSTPRDLLLFARVAMKNPLFRQVVGTQHHKAAVRTAAGETKIREWENTNHLVGVMGVNGIKTGTDAVAKICLLSSREVDGHGYFAVVLGAEAYGRRFVDTANIYKWAAQRKGRPGPITSQKAAAPAATEPADPDTAQ